MKTLLFLISISFAALSYAEPLSMFGVELKINTDCTLSVSDADNHVRNLPLSLPGSSNCRFISHAETNIPHVERIKNSYLVLVESMSEEDGRCISTYTAVAVENDGRVLPSRVNKISGTCGIGRERKVFEYFAHKMQY